MGESSTLKTTKQLLTVENNSIITEGLSGHNKMVFCTSDFVTLILVSGKDIFGIIQESKMSQLLLGVFFNLELAT